jgi:MoxR-like ATPase
MDVEISEIIKVIEGVLGDEPTMTVDINDPRIASIAGVLNKSKVRVACSIDGITIDFTGTAVTFTKMPNGSFGVKHPESGSKKAKKPVAKKPKTDRHKHTYVAPKIARDVMDALLDDASHVLWFKGPTGTGKTALVHHLAKELDMELYQLNCHERMDDTSFFGEKTVEIDDESMQNHITFQEGIVTKAMQAGLDDNGDETDSAKPGLLFIDEAGAMPANVAIALNRLLESDDPRRTIVLERDGGRVVRSHSKFRIILAANTAGRGATDMSSAMYTAQMDALDISLLNRIALTFNFGYDRNVEKKIAREKIENEKIVEQVLKFRDAIRDNLRAGKLSTPFSTRSIIQVSDAYRLYGDLSKAFYYTLFEQLVPEEKVIYNELAVAQLKVDILEVFEDSDIDYM